jgi:hypothetical protein
MTDTTAVWYSKRVTLTFKPSAEFKVLLWSIVHNTLTRVLSSGFPDLVSTIALFPNIAGSLSRISFKTSQSATIAFQTKTFAPAPLTFLRFQILQEQHEGTFDRQITNFTNGNLSGYRGRRRSHRRLDRLETDPQIRTELHLFGFRIGATQTTVGIGPHAQQTIEDRDPALVEFLERGLETVLVQELDEHFVDVYGVGRRQLVDFFSKHLDQPRDQDVDVQELGLAGLLVRGAGLVHGPLQQLQHKKKSRLMYLVMSSEP